jgi:type 1 glutamine amidotransferase
MKSKRLIHATIMPSRETKTMSGDLNRRRLLLAAGAAWLGTGSINRLLAQPKGGTKKVLFFTKSSGFQHPVIARQGDQLGLAERILTEIGKEHGFEVVASKDGRLFEPDQIGQWDAFVLETTGDLNTPGTDKHPPISPDGEKALYDAIRGGKGYMGMHCASDTFGHHGPKYKKPGNRDKGADDPYIQMIGGEFIDPHGAQQPSQIEIADPEFPGIAKGFGTSGRLFTITDEWYPLKNFADNMHVILVQVTEGMKGHMYERPNYPMTWARAYGKGRVFYTSMGHREDVWENPMYQALLLGALGWTTGRVDANVEPNIRQVTPKCDELPK